MHSSIELPSRQKRNKPLSCISATGRLRRLPHNVDAEMAVLGGIITDHRTWDRVSEFLRPVHFVLEEHARIFRACEYHIERGKKCDPVTLKNFFESDDSLQSLGGQEYLIKLTECAATPLNAQNYARHVYDMWRCRELINVGENIIDTAYDSGEEKTPDDQIGDAEAALFSLTDSDIENDFVPISTIIAPVFSDARKALERRRLGLPNGVQTGFADLDAMLGGLEQAQLVILAGRSSMGKTTVALNIAYNVALSYMELSAKERSCHPVAGGKVAIISLETNGPALLRQNLQSRVTGIPGQQLRTGKDLTEEDIDRAEKICREKLAPLPITIMDSIPTVSVIRSRLRRLKRKHGIGLVIIDYLQLIRSTGKKENIYQKVTEISAGLKAIAKELNVPLIVLSQLSRDNEKRDSKRPQLSDLRDSGTIEENADVVMLIYREHYYLCRNEPGSNATQEEFMDWQRRCEQTEKRLEILVAKQRQGPTGTVNLYYDQTTALVANAVSERGRDHAYVS